MTIKTDGLIIKEQTVGESDRLVTVLTRNEGVIRAFARRAKNLRDSKNSSTGLLSYSDFGIYRGKDKYIIENSSPKEIFFGLRKDIVSLSLAQYFCELAYLLVPEQADSAEYLRLILNALHFLADTDKDPLIVKAVVELRILADSGFMPDLVCCSVCKKYESEPMYFLPQKAMILCPDCYSGDDPSAVKISMGVLTAMRHIIYSDFAKIFSFTLPEESLKLLSYTTESYMVNTLGKIPATLSFYKSL